MVNPGNKETMRLVDYSSSSEDEDINRPIYMLNGIKASESDIEMLNKGFISNGDEGDDYSQSDDDSEEDHFEGDIDLLNFGRYSWRKADRWNGREAEYFKFNHRGTIFHVYSIGITGEALCDKSKSLKLLDMIGCGDRFIGCSVETRRRFFANLNKEEVAMMEGLEGVRNLVPLRHCVFDI